jgi:transposase
MAQRIRLAFSEEDRQALSKERYEHPDPCVQRKMEVLWLISQGMKHKEAARFAGVSQVTAARYVALYRQGGLSALRETRWRKSSSALEDHRESLAESFRQNPPHTVAEACVRIQEETSLERRPTQVRRFLKKVWA